MTKRVFVSFAMEDKVYRDLLKGQSLNVSSPFEYVDMSVKEPWDDAWKTRVRSRIKGVDGVIALLSKNVLNASGAKYEIYSIIDQLAANGSGILFISSELEELMGMCDRILVMSRGEIFGEFTRDQFNAEAILHAAFRETAASEMVQEVDMT